MIFAATALGLLVGRVWIGVLDSFLRRSTSAPVVELVFYSAAAAISGLTLGGLQRHALSPTAFVHLASVGFIFGFISYPFFLPGAGRLYRCGRVTHAITHLIVSPLLATVTLFGGYAFGAAGFSFP